MPYETTVDPSGPSTPASELASLGPVIEHNHIAYVPQPSWSNVPGVGTGNLIFAPDTLLSAPYWFAGNAVMSGINAFGPAQLQGGYLQAPAQVLHGIGGITAGQLTHAPLLEVDYSNLENAPLGE